MYIIERCYGLLCFQSLCNSDEYRDPQYPMRNQPISAKKEKKQPSTNCDDLFLNIDIFVGQKTCMLIQTRSSSPITNRQSSLSLSISWMDTTSITLSRYISHVYHLDLEKKIGYCHHQTSFSIFRSITDDNFELGMMFCMTDSI